MRARPQRHSGIQHPDPDEGEAGRIREGAPLRQHTPHEIATLLAHPFEAEVTSRRLPIDLAARDMALLDAQEVQRVEPVGRDPEGLARFEYGLPYPLGAARGHRDLV